MEKQRGEASSGGIGILGLLGVIFVVLKIVDVKPVGDWSWWLVTSPFWGGIVLVAGIFAIGAATLWSCSPS